MGSMDTNQQPEPPQAPDSLTDRTTAHDEAVQPIHSPNVEPAEPPSPPKAPFTGPFDKPTVIDAVIAGQITTREAADLLKTSTDQIRAWKARETARRTKSPTPAKVFRPVSPPSVSASTDTQHTESEGDRPETPPETLSTAEPLQDLQIQDGPETETPNEPTETPTNPQDSAPETPTETENEARRLTGGSARHPASLANLANGGRKPFKKPEDDEGSFEREELETLGNLHRAMARSLRLAENGKDAQAWSVALGNVLDYRRRAAGKSSTLVKEQTPKALASRNAIVFIGNPAQAPTSSTPQIAKARSSPVHDVTEVQDESLNDGPPALKAMMSKAPDYVQRL